MHNRLKKTVKKTEEEEEEEEIEKEREKEEVEENKRRDMLDQIFILVVEKYEYVESVTKGDAGDSFASSHLPNPPLPR